MSTEEREQLWRDLDRAEELGIPLGEYLAMVEPHRVTIPLWVMVLLAMALIMLPWALSYGR